MVKVGHFIYCCPRLSLNCTLTFDTRVGLIIEWYLFLQQWIHLFTVPHLIMVNLSHIICQSKLLQCEWIAKTTTTGSKSKGKQQKRGSGLLHSLTWSLGWDWRHHSQSQHQPEGLTKRNNKTGAMSLQANNHIISNPPPFTPDPSTPPRPVSKASCFHFPFSVSSSEGCYVFLSPL